MMQAIAEGFTILRQADFKLDVSKVAEVYNRGSVVESRLMDWLRRAFELHGQGLSGVTGQVAHTGEGEWTVKTARAMKIKATVIAEALQFRQASAKNPTYAGKILSALREQFGGHAVKGRRG
ncbi:MAG: 6-phosphogluconate dehydrogenase (decarboxylating), partial [Candidatus Kerfeldbacteria bacterium]|nr:6-phosphogluconate dehydrogenase (decarboxylating) [Candidatus Kerfeldbacteria bacterium]